MFEERETSCEQRSGVMVGSDSLLLRHCWARASSRYPDWTRQDSLVQDEPVVSQHLAKAWESNHGWHSWIGAHLWKSLSSRTTTFPSRSPLHTSWSVSAGSFPSTPGLATSCDMWCPRLPSIARVRFECWVWCLWEPHCLIQPIPLTWRCFDELH